jgi:hypothetical protein
VILEVSSTTGNALSFMGDVLLEYLTITGSAPAYYSLIYHMIGSIRINRCIFAGPGISASNTRAIEFDTDTALVIICGFHDFHMVFNAVGALLNVLSWNAENTADNSTLVTGSGSFVSMTNLPPDGSFIALKSLGVGQVLVGDNQINTIRIKLADLENNFDVVFLLGRIPTESSDSPHFTNITEGEVRLLRNGTIGQAPALKIVGFNVAAGYGAPYMTANFNIKLNSGSAVFALGAVTWEGGRYIVIRAAHPLGFRYYNYLKGEFDGSMPMSMIGKMLNFSDVTGWELIAGTV